MPLIRSTKVHLVLEFTDNFPDHEPGHGPTAMSQAVEAAIEKVRPLLSDSGYRSVTLVSAEAEY